MKFLPGLILTILLFTLCLLPSIQAEESSGITPDNWWHFRGGLENIGVSPSVTAPDTNRTVWRFETDDAIYASPVIADGKLFIGSWDKNLYCLDAVTGRELWRFDTQDRIYSSPTYWEGLVFVGTGTEGGVKIAKMYAVNATTGKEVWSFKASKNFVGGVVIVDDIVYTGSLDGTLYALDAWGSGDGTTSVHWRFPTEGEIWCTPAYYNNSLYITSCDCRVYRVDINTGLSMWRYQTEYTLDGMYSSPTIADGMVFLGSGANPLGKFYSLDADTGKHLWNFSTGPSIYGICASPTYHNGVVYIGSNNGKMYAFNASDGKELWNFSTEDDRNGIYSSAVYAAGKLYFGSSDNKFYCINASDKSLVWSYRPKGFAEYGWVSSPAVALDCVYAGYSADNSLYCFGDTVIPSITLGLEIIAEDDRTAEPFFYAGEQIQLAVSAMDSGSGIKDVDLIITADAGSLALEEGKTEDTGIFATGYTAPSFSSAGEVQITVTAEARGYMTNESVFTFEVRLNPPLQYEFASAPSEVVAGEPHVFTMTVLEGTNPFHNASVELRTTNGALSTVSGITDENGQLSFTYTAPVLEETTPTNTTIQIRLISQGYEMGSYELDLEIEPAPPEDTDDDEALMDTLTLGMTATIILLIIIIVILSTVKGKKHW